MARIHPLPTGPGRRTFPELSLESRLLIDFLSKQAPGADVPYMSLEKIIGQSVQSPSRGYHHLTTARRVLLRDHGIVIDVEPKMGVHICTETEKITVSERDIMRGHRANRQARKKLTACDYEALSEDEKKKWNARMSVVSVLDLFATKKAMERIEAHVEDHALTGVRTLELFRSK